MDPASETVRASPVGFGATIAFGGVPTSAARSATTRARGPGSGSATPQAASSAPREDIDRNAALTASRFTWPPSSASAVGLSILNAQGAGKRLTPGSGGGT
ncbi:MAG: hypothetical protein NVS2B9_03100 [Myxococcales bacterium]